MSPKPAVALRRLSRAPLGAALALLASLALGWVDTRPNWDDTGISAGLLLIGAAVAGLTGAPWWLAGGLMAAPRGQGTRVHSAPSARSQRNAAAG